jgi:hypothetical protein
MESLTTLYLSSLTLPGLHFAPAGYRVLYEEFMNLMGRDWPDQMPEKLPFPLPVWNDVDRWRKW